MPYLRTLRILLVACGWLCFAPTLPTAGAQTPPVAPSTPTASTFTLTILHTNDLHGHVLPFAYTEAGRSKDEQPSVGGAARRATLVRDLRHKIGNPTVLIDSGDTFTRGPFTNAYEGLADIEAMNTVGYEIAALGNNEFKAKDGADQNDAPGAQAALLQVVKHSRFPWLCANATDEKGAFLEGVQPYVVRVYNGVRVGFLGLTAPRSASYPQTKGWHITDPIAAAKEWIPKARAHCDILLAVTHIGVDGDKDLAAQTSGLDAIIGGDSHTFLYKSVEVKNLTGNPVPIVQDGEFGVNLGRFDLHFDRNPANTGYRLARYEYELLPVGPKLKEAPDVVATVEPFARPFREIVGKVAQVGKTPEERTRFTTQVLVDALRNHTHADYALNPSGDGMFDAFHAASVTRFDVYAAFPFHNRVATARLTGAQLQALLKAAPTTVLSGSGAAIQADQSYQVAFVDFIASSTYKIPPDQITTTDSDIRDAILAYLGQPK